VAEKINKKNKEGRFKMLRKATKVTALIICAVCIGCESPSQHKKAAQEKWEKTTAQIKLTLARQQVDEGNYDQAAETVQQCLSVDPNNPAAHLLYGKLLLADDRHNRAIGHLWFALQSNENLHEGWYWLGVAAQENKDYQRACEYYEKALSLEPMNVEYILAVADVHVARDDSYEAVTLLTAKIAALPQDVSLKVAAADVMYQLGRNEQAIELYKQAMLMASDNDEIAEALGYCYVFGGEWKEAAEIFNKLSARAADQQKKKLYLQVTALCSMNSAQYGRAVNCYSELSVEQRDDAAIWLKMGQAALGTRTTKRALMCGRKALALRPGYADAIALVGCAQYARGDYNAAVKSFEEIAADSKNEGFSWFMRARCYEQLGQTSKAERAYRKAVEINPHSELNAYLVNYAGAAFGETSQNENPESYFE
jgi:tetratricopeptide (TPR) repeat protein